MIDPDRLPTVVLASGSPRRLELLRQVGIEPDVEPADVEELLAEGEDPRIAVERLAREKASAVAARHEGDPDLVVLGADTLVVVDRRPLGKPLDADDAVAMLSTLSGRSHEVLTGVAVQRGDRVASGVASTTVRFRGLSTDEIERYVATGEPLDKAGAYGIQGRAAVFVDGIDGDHSNVVGLPLPLVDRLLSEICDGT